ncbi:adenosylcobinamide-GDP ribazoletransferase [Devosia sp.]|uniref:adenosylcobinamide-GDP ribazoletransferase n=1 Tax=Devosia sp. TaxID=1871048 RepID=UPI003A90670F
MQFDPDQPKPDRPRQDNHPDAPAQSWRWSDDLLMGLRFYSRLPTGDRPFEKPDLTRIALGLPFTSLVIGIGPALLLLLGALVGLPGLMAATLAVGAMIAVTGAMGEDALGDTADGLIGGSTIERRLEIMKDSRHGTYGVSAMVLFIALRITALGSLAAINPLAAAGVWLAVEILGRSGALWLTVDLHPAREGGASASVGRLRRRGFFIGAGFAALLAFVFAAPFTSLLGVVLAVFVAAGVALGWSQICRRLIGGQTGDLIGALGALIEIASLTVLMIFA